MNGDFNQLGSQYEYQAVAGEQGHYNLLAKTGCKFYEGLQKYLCQKWHEEPDSPELKRWSSSLECLQAFLYQMSRMPKHSNNLHSSIPPLEQMLGISGVDVLADFESLLYLARSALDRITFAIAKQTYNLECEKFNKLENILGNFTKREKRALYAINVINAVLDDFRGTLIDYTNGKTGLRSTLAHSRSTGESLNHGFTAHRLSEHEAIFFDMELDKHGVFATSYKLNRSVPYVMLNLIALFTDYDSKLTLKDCEPSWNILSVCLSEYIDNSGKGLNFSTLKATACGFKIQNHNVKKEMFNCAVKV